MDAAFYLAGWFPYASSAQDLLAHLDAAGFDRAVCFPMPTPSAFAAAAFASERALVELPDRFPFDLENASLLRELDRLEAGDRLLPFAMFDPGRHTSAQADRLREMRGRVRGLKTQTTLLRSPVRALLDEASELMAVAEEFDLPVVLHTAVDPADQWAQARDCLAVASAFPGVRFSLAHSLRFDADALREASQLANVWVDCSAHLLHCQLARSDVRAIAPANARVDADYAAPASVLEAVHDLLGGCYLWGSDNPFQSWADDKFNFIYRYSEEVAVLRDLPTTVARSMTRDAPQAWLTGSAEPSIGDPPRPASD